MKSVEDIQRDIAEYVSDARDDAELWGRERPTRALDLMADAMAVMSSQDAQLRYLRVLLEVAEERGGNYMEQARQANKRLETRKQKPEQTAEEVTTEEKLAEQPAGLRGGG